jgi:cytoskeletal protein CcmA (bactofilin family)
MAKAEEIAKSADPNSTRAENASVLGSSLVLKGEISGDEDLVIRGTFHGSIRIGNRGLFIERGARVEADVEADHVSIAGALTGDITAAGWVSLSSEARMKGEITAAKIQIRDGAQFRGGIKMAKGGA